jgi:hypothetical protein
MAWRRGSGLQVLLLFMVFLGVISSRSVLTLSTTEKKPPESRGRPPPFIGSGEGWAPGGFLKKEPPGDGKTRRPTMG